MNNPETPPNQPTTPVPPLDDDEDEPEEEEEEEEDDEDNEESAATHAAGAATARNLIRAVPTLDSLYGHSDLAKDAVCWSLSSAKPGNGVHQIRDSNVETYWQSDGSQPHAIQVTFRKRVAVSHVCFYLDYNLDESYTPKKVCIETGMTLQDLQTATMVELSEPVGWCIVPLEAPLDPLEDEETVASTGIIRTHLVQISILSMHQNGRDTHVRQVKLFGPKRGESHYSRSLGDGRLGFSTVALSQFSTVR